MLNVKNTIVDSLLSFVAPHLCSGCGSVGSSFCPNCKYDITSEPFSGCVLCEKQTIQGICDEHKAAFNQAWVVGIRSGALQRLIGGFKFRNMKSVSVELAELLDTRLPDLPANTVFVPIPTIPAHIRERGYDHMLLVTSMLARRRQLPMATVLQRNTTAVQHRANRQQRITQAAAAFKIESHINPSKIYVLVDDILTTGATVQQAASLLAAAGATVWVAVIARQPID
jgi:competence protein ComFC